MDDIQEKNFEIIFGQICSRLKSAGEVEATSKQFAAQATDPERYSFVIPLLKDYDLSDSSSSTTEKSESTSSSLREKGNEKFRKKCDLEALELYTKSILFAPADSKVLALGYGNRSAVLKSLNKYDDCVLDIHRALCLNFPEAIKFKILVRLGECYKAMGKFEKANQALQKAQENLKYADLDEEKSKVHRKIITNLIADCNELSMEEQKISYKSKLEYDLPCKSYGQNEEILCASTCVKIEYNHTMGRHLTAASNIEPGDVIIVEEPYAWILLPEYVASHCGYCLKRCASLIPCPTCVNEMYCGESCLEAAYKKYHHVECKISSTLLQLDMGKMSLLAVRILSTTSLDFLSKFLKEMSNQNPPSGSEEMRTLGFNQENHYDSLDFSPIFNLISNTETRSVSDLFKRSLMAACLMKCLRLDLHEDSELFGGLLLRFLQNLPCNAHEISETVLAKGGKEVPLSLEIGAAAYACLSLLNHSCDPNVVRHSHGNTAVLRAIKFIPKGSEILDNYGYHFAVHPKESRQMHLKSQYLFECNCEACSKSWPLHQDLPNLPLNIAEINIVQDSSKKLEELIKKCLAGAEISSSGTKVFQHLKFLQEKGARLCQEFNCCQEIAKQLFARQGNFYYV